MLWREEHFVQIFQGEMPRRTSHVLMRRVATKRPQRAPVPTRDVEAGAREGTGRWRPQSSAVGRLSQAPRFHCVQWGLASLLKTARLDDGNSETRVPVSAQWMRLASMRVAVFTSVTRGCFLDVGVKILNPTMEFLTSAQENDRASPSVKTP